MSRILKYVGIAFASVVGILVVCAAGLFAWTNRELSATVPVPTHAFTAPTGDSAVARGEHVTKALAKCGDCHGADYGGSMMVNDAAIGTIFAPNITSGPGGRLANMTDADVERAVRHGVTSDGRRLAIMPSSEYQTLSDNDIGAIIAYLRSVPPVDRESVPLKFGPLARALHLAGKMPWFPSEDVTHVAEVVGAPVADSTIEYGRYLATGGCSGCHGANYSGGPIHGAPPDWPHAANITPTGLQAKKYDYPGFVRALSEGIRPDGTAINPMMPVSATKLMTPVEMRALWLYIETVAPAETGVR